jgi:hypothetical protein
MASRGSSKASSDRGPLMTPKNIGIVVATVVIVGFMTYQLLDMYGVINKEPVSTDPAVVDPVSTYTPEEKKQLEKIEQQQKVEMERPNAPPPSGS